MGNKHAKKNSNSHLQTFHLIFTHYGMIDFNDGNQQPANQQVKESTIAKGLKEIIEGKYQIKLNPELEDKICGWIIKNFTDLEKWKKVEVSRQAVSGLGKLFDGLVQKSEKEWKNLVLDMINFIIPKYLKGFGVGNRQLCEVTIFNSDLQGEFPNIDLLTTLDKSHKLQDLDFSINNLTSLNEDWFTGKLSLKGESDLRKLALSGNMFENLNISNGERVIFPNLKNIYLHNNILLKTFPKWVCYQPVMETLKLYECQIEGLIPKELFIHAKKMNTLEMYNNNLDGFETFNENELNGLELLKLSTLVLHTNNISQLPSTLFNSKVFGNLKELFISFNSLTTFPESMGDLKHLHTIIAESNQISEIPSSFANLTGLREVNFAFNKLARFPTEFLELENLETLELNNNAIEEVPLEATKWSKLVRLSKLTLSGNLIKKLPENWISESCLFNIQRLNVGYNLLEELNIFGTFDSDLVQDEKPIIPRLSQFMACGNQVKQFPNTLVEIFKETLQVIYLGHNEIESIPDLSIVSRLVHLNLCYNKIEGELRDVLQKVMTSKLKYLNLEGNFITETTVENLNQFAETFRVPSSEDTVVEPGLKEIIISPQQESNTESSSQTAVVKPCGFIASCNGTVRPEMEDAHVVSERQSISISNQQALLSIYGIFDGHAGDSVPHWVAEHYISITHKLLPKDLPTLSNDSTTEEKQAIIEKLKLWMNESLLKVDQQCYEEHSKEFKDGCTAVVCAVFTFENLNKEQFVIFGNVGDARGIIGECIQGTNNEEETTTNGHYKVERMTYDHKPSGDASEVLRIRSVGGYVINGRTMGNYGVARSIGDWDSRPYLSGEPFVNAKLIPQPETTTDGQSIGNIIILGCDGVWDVLSDEIAIETTRSYTQKRLCNSSSVLTSSIGHGSASYLRDFAHSSSSTDNISAIVIFL